jgi:hypothetical protein
MEPFHGNSPRTIPDLLIDSDRRVFIDYLECTVMIAYPDDRPFTEFLDAHKSSVVSKLNEFMQNPYVKAKYDWAAVYHNSFCETYPDLFSEDDKISSAYLHQKPQAWTLTP